MQLDGYRGESVSIPIDLDSETSSAYTLDGTEVVRVSALDDSEQLAEFPLTLTDAEAGQATVALDLTNTTLPVGVYRAQLVRPAGPLVIVTGTLTVSSIIQ